MKPIGRSWAACWAMVCVAAWLLPSVGSAQVVISEFMARNESSLRDLDGEYSDWIELTNVSGAELDLGGYSLTDDTENLLKWVFPAVLLQPGQAIVVFASGKDLVDTGSELHTNFRLSSAGEPLFLIAPGGANVVAGFPPQFPAQISDVSYGLATDSTFFTLVEERAPVRVLVPVDDSLGLTWVLPEFDDSSWMQGVGGVGFETGSGFEEFIGTDLEAEMDDTNATAYIRIPFTVEDPMALDTLRLRVRYDDGFVAFLNGERVTDANGPATEELSWNSEATSSHSDRLAVEFETFDISASRDLLVTGENILAIQGLNFSPSSGDFLVQLTLEGIQLGEVRTDEFLYFPEPTPGEPNGPGVPGIADPPEFSHDSGAFTETQMVTLSTPIAGAEIRYTTDGTTPNESSTLYESPVVVNQAMEVRARTFVDGLLPSPTERRTFILIDRSIQNFSSNIPVVIVNTFGRAIPNNCEGAYTPGHLTLLEPGEDGRLQITDEPTFSHRVAYRRRGSSTCGREKFSFNVEIRNDEDEEEDVSLFGWPEHADFAMYGPYNFDRALVRNPLMYELSRQSGRYAVRTRFVECYLHTRNGAVGNASYWGVYVFMERNKRGRGRIDVERTSSQDNTEPDVTGGYIMKVDRADGAITVSGGGLTCVMVHPKVPTTQQRSYLTGYLNALRGTLDPETILERDGEYIDVGSWIDHHILNVFPKNVDAFRLSGYMFKDREGPLHLGPVWDYDRTMGCADDGRASDPFSWPNTGGDGGTQYFAFGWYGPLFRNQPPLSDSAWNRAYRARWRELRQGALSSTNVSGTIDAMAAELTEAAARNESRWPQVRGRFGGWAGEINHLRTWMENRGDWIDSQFVEPPVLSHPGGRVEPPFTLEITVDSEAAQIYYTLDGEDPRGTGGSPSPSAILYTGPITITENAAIVARSREGSLWSGPTGATFVTYVPPLAVTEIMYHPPDPTLEEDPNDDFSASNMEFIEVQNVGSEPLELSEGFRFSRGVTFAFGEGSIPTLLPGETIVVVQNLEAFRARYGDDIAVAGEYRGSLSDSGEEVTLLAPLDVEISSFRYEDDWYPETDGEGPSLEAVSPEDLLLDREDPANWRVSATRLGTPGVGANIVVGPSAWRLPGDIDGDQRLSVVDASRLLGHLFGGSTTALPCGDEIGAQGNSTLLDSDGDGGVTLSDAVRVLQYVFQRGQPPALGADCVRVSGCEVDACAR